MTLVSCELPTPTVTFPTDDRMKLNTFRLSCKPLPDLNDHFRGVFTTDDSEQVNMFHRDPMRMVTLSAPTVTSYSEALFKQMSE